MLLPLIEAPRYYKRLLGVALDTVLLPLCLYAAFALRMSSWWPPEVMQFWWLFAAAPALAIPLFIRIGMYRAVLRYMETKAMSTIFAAVALHVLLLMAVVLLLGISGVPRSVFVIYWVLVLLSLGGARMVARSMLQSYLRARQGPKRTVVFGAGPAGVQLVNSLRDGPDFHPVAFIDAKRRLQNTDINGLPVHSPQALDRLVQRDRVECVLLAIPGASAQRRREVLDHLGRHPVLVQSVPALSDLVTGRRSVEELREVSFEDLIGRETVPPDRRLLAAGICDRTVMVTGAGGSIGAEMCRQALALRPARLIAFDVAENALYEIDRELRDLARRDGAGAVELVPLLGSVRDRRRLDSIMHAFDVQTVYHAAAYKHVPLVEHNPIAGVKNNVFGTLHAARAAADAGVETFVLVSSDKAVRPTNVMGATKRLAEMIVQELAEEERRDTCFSMVRFGNVLGSSGSVVPLFREQIRHGGPVTVTHREAVRYFMTVSEAVQLVMQAGAMAQGGDVFLLDMGEPVSVWDLARRMIHLSGLRVRDERDPHGDIEIRFTGLRPGEKLREELLVGDGDLATAHPLIKRAVEERAAADVLHKTLAELDAACERFDSEAVRRILLDAVAGYRPQCDIQDPVWLNSRSKRAVAMR